MQKQSNSQKPRDKLTSEPFVDALQPIEYLVSCAEPVNLQFDRFGKLWFPSSNRCTVPTTSCFSLTMHFGTHGTLRHYELQHQRHQHHVTLMEK